MVNDWDGGVVLVGDVVWEGLKEGEMGKVEGMIVMREFRLLVWGRKELEYGGEELKEMFGKKFGGNLGKEDVR